MIDNKYPIYIFVLILIGLELFNTSPVKAEIYRYIDKDGVMHFTNVPSQSHFTLYKPHRKNHQIKYSNYNSNKYDHIIREASQHYGVSFSLLKAVIKAESSFNPLAVSKKGALGLMQIMPMNLQSLGIKDPFDPRENIFGGTRYLRYLLEFFGGKLDYAIAGYNAGPNAVLKYDGVPPFRETQQYLKKVTRYYQEYSH